MATLALRRDPRLLKLPPHFSAFLILVGVVWLLLLPLDQYSRHTYISENALLPGQVHTYFGGSEQQIFNAYRHEVQDAAAAATEAAGDNSRSQDLISQRLCAIFASAELKCAKQKYAYHVAGREYAGENVYAVLRAPRGDATEAVVLAAAWTNIDGRLNVNGVSLVLTLARYFKRWSLWSKDIIILVTPDSKAGPQAWVDAYHDEQDPSSVGPLPEKSGALQGAIVVDNALDHGFQALHIIYDGVNGQLPNLDLFNTAVAIASGHMGINIALQGMWVHRDSYRERLQTMLRGMGSQATGLSSGPHSSFFPYHVDAITLQAGGKGPFDEMALGRVVESIFRSLNNLLEHFHQSFFLYILMQSDRFVSIGTYLPSAMLVAGNFTIMAIALWIRSGRPSTSTTPIASTHPEKKRKEETEVIQKDGMIAIVPKADLAVQERQLLVPILFVAGAHVLGLIPLYMFNSVSTELLSYALQAFALLFDFLFPSLVARFLASSAVDLQPILVRCFSLLLLGMFLAALATLNFSLSLLIGLAATPFSFIGTPLLDAKEGPGSLSQRNYRVYWSLLLQAVSPPAILWLVSVAQGKNVAALLSESAFGWKVNGMWTQVVCWCVWWPAWLITSVLASPVI